MAGWRSLFRRGLLLRKVATELSGIEAALREQNALLARLADHYAPRASPAAHRPASAVDTGVDFLDVDELALAEAYVARTRADTGHEPDEDEVLIYLADEKTQALHARLKARDRELAAAAARRRGET